MLANAEKAKTQGGPIVKSNVQNPSKDGTKRTDQRDKSDSENYET